MTETAPATSTPSRSGLIEAGVIVVVAIACLIFQLWLPSTHVAEADYVAVGEVLKNEGQPGDAVMLAPWWTERARLFAPEAMPVTGYQGCESDSLETNQRIWLLAEPHQPRAGLTSFMEKFSPGRSEVGPERTFGNLTLRLFQNGRFHPTTFNAVEQLPAAHLYLQNGAGERRDCQFDGVTHHCPTGNIGVEWHDINFAPHQCIRFNGPAVGLKVTAEFNGVPASQVLALSAGYIGETGYYKGPTIGDAALTLDVNGQLTNLPLLQQTIALQRVEQRNTPEGATVRVSITSTNPLGRDICFELRGFGAAP